MEREHRLSPERLNAEVARQLDIFRTNKQAPRGCFGTRKYADRSAVQLATEKLQTRGGRGAAGVIGWVQAHTRADPTPVSDVIGRVARAHGYTTRELETRLNDPASLLGGYIGGEDEDSVTCRQAYARLSDQRWASSCGQTSDLLKDLISNTWVKGPALGSKPGREVVDDLKAAINNPANTHVRLQVGCHSFMIEKQGGNCRIYQSYMAMGYDGYGLADSLRTDRPMSTRRLCRLLDQLFDDRTNDAAATRLFRGTCDPYANGRDGDFCVQFETTSAPRTARGLEGALEAKLRDNSGEWNRLRGSDELASAYALRNLT